MIDSELSHRCHVCHGVIRWSSGERDAKGRRLGACACRPWREAATTKYPLRRPRWKSLARSRETHRRRRKVEQVRRARRPPYDDVLPVVRTYREQRLSCQLAADCEGMPIGAWIRRALSAEAGRVLRARGHRVPRRVLDLAAAGRLEQLEQLAASLAPPASPK